MSCGIRHAEFVDLTDNGKQDKSEKGQPNGYAGLDATGHVPAINLDLTAYAKAADVASEIADLATATQTAIAAATAKATADDTALKAEIEADADAIFARKTDLAAYIDPTELQTALGPYAKTADVATKGELAGYIPESEKGQPSGVAALDANGKVARDALLYKAQGVVAITQDTVYAPLALQGYVADCNSDNDCEVHITSVAQAGGAQPGGITPFFKTGLGRLFFTKDDSITLIVDSRYLPESEGPVGTVMLLTCITPTKYVLTGQLKVKS